MPPTPRLSVENSAGGGGYQWEGGGGRGGLDWIGSDWSLALFGRTILGSQAMQPTRLVTLTCCERPQHARGPRVSVPRPHPSLPQGPESVPHIRTMCSSTSAGAQSRYPTYTTAITVSTRAHSWCPTHAPRARQLPQGPKAGAPLTLDAFPP